MWIFYVDRTVVGVSLRYLPVEHLTVQATIRLFHLFPPTTVKRIVSFGAWANCIHTENDSTFSKNLFLGNRACGSSASESSSGVTRNFMIIVRFTLPNRLRDHRRFGALGGGGSKGIPPPIEKPKLPLLDPSKLDPAATFLSRPGIDILKV